MTWFRVDDEFLDSPKILPLEDDWRLWCDCLALWLAAGVYCSRAQTDGRIKRSRLQRLTPMPAIRSIKVADALVDMAKKGDSEFGLWERDGEDYVFHDWLHYQPSAEEIAEAKENNRDRQKRFRNKRREARNTLRNGDDNEVDNTVTNGTPTRPDPTLLPSEEDPTLTLPCGRERENMPVAWGRDIRRRRKALRLTQDQLGAKLAASGRAVSQWERGTAEPDADHRARIDTVLCALEGHQGTLRGELAAAATQVLNQRSGASYQPDGEDVRGAARLWQLWGWDAARVTAVVAHIADGLADHEGGKFVRPATVYQERRMLRAAEELDAGHRPQPTRPMARLNRDSRMHSMPVAQPEDFAAYDQTRTNQGG